MQEKIHGYLLNFDERLRDTAIYYLECDLNYAELRTLFEAARAKGRAYFENKAGRNFVLSHRGDGTYDLTEG